ncbi:hypothetical protein J6590_064253 [Homalodisca vitripennis]|nr:hypothetical protein J6590_064253 [Homalodisca vitripennis]
MPTCEDNIGGYKQDQAPETQRHLREQCGLLGQVRRLVREQSLTPPPTTTKRRCDARKVRYRQEGLVGVSFRYRGHILQLTLAYTGTPSPRGTLAPWTQLCMHEASRESCFECSDFFPGTSFVDLISATYTSV